MIEWRVKNQVGNPKLVEHRLYFEDKYTSWSIQAVKSKDGIYLWQPTIQINAMRFKAPRIYILEDLKGAKAWVKREWIKTQRPEKTPK